MDNPNPNVYQYFIQVSIYNQMNNIYTLENHNLALNVISTGSQTLAESWTTGDASGTIAKEIATVVDGNSMNGFITNDLSNLQDPAVISELSEKVGSDLMRLLGKYYQDIVNKIGSDQATMDMNVVNSVASIISSQANNEEQIGQNLSKTEGSVVQQDSTMPQVYTDITNSVESQFSNIASLVQQIYS